MRNRFLTVCSCLGLAALTAGAQTAGGGGGGAGGGGSAGGSAGSAGAGTTSGIAGGAGIGPAGNTTAGTANGTSVNTRYGVNTGSPNGTTVNSSNPRVNQQSQGVRGNAGQQTWGVQNGQIGAQRQLPQGAVFFSSNSVAQQQYGGQNQFWTGASNPGPVQVFGATNQVTWASNYNDLGNQGTLPGSGTVVAGDGSATQASGATPQATGTPATQASIQAANQTAARGLEGTQQNTPETGDKAYTAADQSLLVKLRDDVLPVVRGSSTGISPVRFSVRHGVVTLSGDVPNAAIRQQVLDTVQGAAGVVQVVDNLTVGNSAIGAGNVIEPAATSSGSGTSDSTRSANPAETQRITQGGSSGYSSPATSSAQQSAAQQRHDPAAAPQPNSRLSNVTSNTFGGSYTAPFSVGTAGTNLTTADQIRSQGQSPGSR